MESEIKVEENLPRKPGRPKKSTLLPKPEDESSLLKSTKWLKGRRKSSRNSGKRFRYDDDGVTVYIKPKNEQNSEDEEEERERKIIKMASVNGIRCKVFENSEGKLFKVNPDNQDEEEIDVEKDEVTFEDANNTKRSVLCPDCGHWFVNENSILRHQRAGNCNKGFCKSDHEHNLLEKEFDSMDEAREWIKDMHLDKDFMTTTFKGGEIGQAYYSCMYAGKNQRKGGGAKVAKSKIQPKPEEAKERKIALQGETCKAKIRIRPRRVPDAAGEKGLFRLNACLAHNHELLPRKQRIPARVRDAVLDFLMKGMPSVDILKYKFESPQVVANYPKTGVFLHRGAIESIKRKLPKDFEVPKVAPATTITVSSSTIEGEGPAEQYLLWHTVVGFHLPMYPYESPLLSQELRDKYLYTQGFLAVMFMSEEQNTRLTKYPHTLILDVTSLDKVGHQILTGLVVDSKSESSPVFQVIIEQARIEIISAVLTRLKSINPEATSRLRYLCCRMMEPKMTNEILSDSKNIFGAHLQPLYTIKQFLQSLKQDFKSAEVTSAIQQLRHEPDPAQFDQLMSQFQQIHGGSDEGRRFLAEYGSVGSVIPSQYWATCYGAVMLQSNLGIKHYKTEIIRILKSDSEMPDIESGLLPKLIDLDAKYARAEEVKVLEVGSFTSANRRSYFVAFDQCHADPADFQVALRPDQSISIWDLNSPASESGVIVVRSVAPVCNESLCQTRCRKCPKGSLCVHAFQCTCPQFTDERLCKHLHVAISVCFVGSAEDPMTLHRRIVVGPEVEPEGEPEGEVENALSTQHLERRKNALAAVRKLNACIKNSSEKDFEALERVVVMADQLCQQFH